MRKFIDIMENVSDPVLAAINFAVEKFGRNILYGGNCGMFALALAQHLRGIGIKSQVVIICEDVFDYDADVSPKDIMAAEIKIYHVAISVEEQMYDGDGAISRNHIADWVEEEYEDYEPAMFNYDPGEEGLVALISNDTAWTISSSEFLKCWEDSQ